MPDERKQSALSKARFKHSINTSSFFRFQFITNEQVKYLFHTRGVDFMYFNTCCTFKRSVYLSYLLPLFVIMSYNTQYKDPHLFWQ